MNFFFILFIFLLWKVLINITTIDRKLHHILLLLIIGLAFFLIFFFMFNISCLFDSFNCVHLEITPSHVWKKFA